MKPTCKVCGARLDLEDLWSSAQSKQDYVCGCGRSWSADQCYWILHLSGREVYPGFKLKRPTIKPGRRKNGARPGVTFPRPVDWEQPTDEEITKLFNWFCAHLDDGADCPVCTRFAQRQHRALGTGPARWLIELVYLCDAKQYIHTGEVIKNLSGHKISGSDATSVLSLYGMIEEGKEPLRAPRPSDPKGRTSGFWRPTQIGRDFVFDKVQVPARIVTCVGIPERFEGPAVTIREALGKKFNYDEIMGRFKPEDK